MQILNGKFIRSEMNKNARGGTEIIAEGLAARVDPTLLQEVQIITSRVEEPLDETKIRIYHLQDLPGDPASDHLKNGGWNKFHKLVFASNWQMQGYINHYGIPWSKCTVIQNCIDPVEHHDKPNDGTLRLAYWSTPHRGLNILVPVFSKLCEKYDNIELDVYSSFKLYGWEQRDEQYEALFEACRNHPKINYRGTVENDVLRDNLLKTHILAYPSIWQETSCITLMEAMSAGLVCVHPNLGALHETAAGWTHMYQWNEDVNAHAHTFYAILDNLIETYWDHNVQTKAASGRMYANLFYNWQYRKLQWEALSQSLLQEPRALPNTSNSSEFVYRVG